MPPTLYQDTYLRGQADGREKYDEQSVARSQRELEPEVRGVVHHPQEQQYQQAPGYRFRDIELTKELDLVIQVFAQEQDKDSDDNRLSWI